MLRLGKRQAAAAGLTTVVGLATVGWIGAQQIRSPARVAADTAPPPASNITVPVVRRTLSTDVVVRGTVRYGAPQPVVLATSHLKQAAGKQGNSDIVTRPPRKGANLSQGRVAMSVDGRPVFLLRGTIPMHRDLGPGDAGPDVRQLERSLAALGFPPGPVDGRYDDATQSAVSSFYLSRGWDPFGPTDTQLDQLRTARATAAAARDAHLQAINAIQQAQRTPTAAEAAQARIDAVVARDAVDTSRLAAQAAQAKLETARAAAARAPAARNVAIANARRDQAVADADVATKQAALDAAIDDERLARLRINEVPLESPPSEREAASAAARQATAKVAQARADLAAATATANASRVGGPAAVQQAGDDATQAARDVTSAQDELRRARLGVRTAESQARLASGRARLMTRPTDTAAMHDIARASADEERRTNAEVARLAKEGGVQVPANEVVFLPSFPLRVDAVKAKRGDTVTGRVMDVTGATLAIDSSLSVSDRKLVHRGDRVVIEDQDLGITTHGSVRDVADTPGTAPPGINRVDPSRYYLGITPQSGPSSLVGSSVKLTIAVESSRGKVLTVPVSTLSVGGDGSSRVQIQRGGRTELVKVIPGLAAQGLVEVRPVGAAELRPGDLVVVGSRTGSAALPPAPAGGGP